MSSVVPTLFNWEKSIEFITWRNAVSTVFLSSMTSFYCVSVFVQVALICALFRKHGFVDNYQLQFLSDTFSYDGSGALLWAFSFIPSLAIPFLVLWLNSGSYSQWPKKDWRIFCLFSLFVAQYGLFLIVFCDHLIQDMRPAHIIGVFMLGFGFTILHLFLLDMDNFVSKKLCNQHVPFGLMNDYWYWVTSVVIAVVFVVFLGVGGVEGAEWGLNVSVIAELLLLSAIVFLNCISICRIIRVTIALHVTNIQKTKNVVSETQCFKGNLLFL